MIRCVVSRWNPERRFERVSEPSYAAIPAVGSHVHFRLEGVRDMELTRVVEVEFFPGSDPIVWVATMRELQWPPARWSSELLHEGFDLLMACYLNDPANREKRPSNTTLQELMLWSAEQVRAAREGTS